MNLSLTHARRYSMVEANWTRVAVKVDADCHLVYKGDRAVLQRQYVLMTIVGIKDMVKCEHVTRGQSDTAWAKLSHIRNRSTPQEVRQAEFIKQQGGAFITVGFDPTTFRQTI